MHLSDDRLVALLDGELPPSVSAVARAHLGECPDCRMRREQLARHRQEIAELLDQLDSATPAVSPDRLIARAGRRTGPRRGLLAAGLTALLIGGAAVVFAGSLPRQWLARVFHRLVGTPAQEPSRRTPPGRSGIALAAGRSLSLSFRARQSVGSIRISIVPDSQVTVQALGDTVAYEVGTDAVTIGNDVHATTSYEIRLPKSLSRARVRVGDRIVFAKDDSAVVSLVTPNGATGDYLIPFNLLRAHGGSVP